MISSQSHVTFSVGHVTSTMTSSRDQVTSSHFNYGKFTIQCLQEVIVWEYMGQLLLFTL